LIHLRLARCVFDLNRIAFLELVPDVRIYRVRAVDFAPVGAGETVIDFIRGVRIAVIGSAVDDLLGDGTGREPSLNRKSMRLVSILDHQKDQD